MFARIRGLTAPIRRMGFRTAGRGIFPEVRMLPAHAYSRFLIPGSILLLGIVGSAPSAAPAGAIAGAADAFVKSQNFSGVVLVGRNGRILFERGYGLSNRELDVSNTPQ